MKYIVTISRILLGLRWSFAKCKRRTGPTVLQRASRPAGGLSRFSGGNGWGGADRLGDGSLVLLAPLSSACGYVELLRN